MSDVFLLLVILIAVVIVARCIEGALNSRADFEWGMEKARQRRWEEKSREYSAYLHWCSAEEAAGRWSEASWMAEIAAGRDPFEDWKRRSAGS